MRSFLEYYNDMHLNVPEEYNYFSSWSSCVWHDMINEGLITSYPKSSVVKFLQSISDDTNQLKITSTKDDTTIDILISIQNQDINSFSEQLSQKLKVYGYYIGKTNKQNDFGDYKLLLEPKYPELLTKEELLSCPFYHMTHEMAVPKIKKNGLTPRDSTTLFTHPGGRIYLIQTKDIGLLDRLKREIIKHRSWLSGEPLSKYSKHWTIENMACLEVKIPDGIKIYKDPMFPVGPDHNAVFTTSNIGPEYITFPK